MKQSRGKQRTRIAGAQAVPPPRPVAPSPKPVVRREPEAVRPPRLLSVLWNIAFAFAALAAMSVVFLALFLRDGGSEARQAREQGKVAEIFRSGIVSHGGRILPVARMDPEAGVTVLRDGAEVQVHLSEIVPVRVTRQVRGGK